MRRAFGGTVTSPNIWRMFMGGSNSTNIYLLWGMLTGSYRLYLFSFLFLNLSELPWELYEWWVMTGRAQSSILYQCFYIYGFFSAYNTGLCFDTVTLKEVKLYSCSKKKKKVAVCFVLHSCTCNLFQRFCLLLWNTLSSAIFWKSSPCHVRQGCGCAVLLL